MSYKEKYLKRLRRSANTAPGETPTLRDSQIHRAKRSQVKSFFDSPTLRKILYNDEETYAIRSDRYRDVELQLFLFEPDKDVKIGSVIKDGEYTYLATQKNGEEIFPELITELCNDVFEIPGGMDTKVTQDRFGNPIYTQVPTDPIPVPAVVNDKDYSTSGNAIVPLPSGRINIQLPFDERYLEHFKVNFEFEHSGGDYKVTDIRTVNITPTEKFIKVSATRVVNDA